MTDKTRYTDEELVEFKELLDKKLADAESDLKLLKEVLTNESEREDAGRAEEGEEQLSLAERDQLIARQEKFIGYLYDAQARIKNKTYGLCRVTGRLISKERLRLVPHATLSIEAKNQGL